jgi:hypothetical protein
MEQGRTVSLWRDKVQRKTDNMEEKAAKNDDKECIFY